MSWSSELEHWHDMYDASVAAGLDRDLAVQLADRELEDAMAIKYSENTLISESSAKPLVIARLAAKDVYFFSLGEPPKKLVPPLLRRPVCSEEDFRSATPFMKAVNLTAGLLIRHRPSYRCVKESGQSMMLVLALFLV